MYIYLLLTGRFFYDICKINYKYWNLCLRVNRGNGATSIQDTPAGPPKEKPLGGFFINTAV